MEVIQNVVNVLLLKLRNDLRLRVTAILLIQLCSKEASVLFLQISFKGLSFIPVNSKTFNVFCKILQSALQSNTVNIILMFCL